MLLAGTVTLFFGTLLFGIGSLTSYGSGGGTTEGSLGDNYATCVVEFSSTIPCPGCRAHTDNYSRQILALQISHSISSIR